MSSNWKDAPTLIEDVKGEISAYCYAAKRQIGRIFDVDVEPGREYTPDELSPAIEFHFLITALWRVRSLLVLLKSTGHCGSAAVKLAEFDKLLPTLKDARDTFEHFDARLKGKKHKDKPIKLARMRSWFFVDDFVWLDAGVVPDVSESGIPLDRDHIRLNQAHVVDAIDLALGFVATLSED